MIPQPPRPGQSHAQFWIALFAVGAIAAAVHWPSVSNGFTNWDDTPYISNNLHMRSVDGLKRIWLTTESPQYYPLTFTSFWVEYQLWGDEPRGYHVVNVALHALNAMLVVCLLRALGMSVGAAFAVALLFAVSPIQVMSVAWVAQRKNTLSTAFGLLSMLCAARYFQREKIGWYVAAAVMFAAALLSKATWVVLPVVIFSTAVWIQRIPARRTLLPLIPFVAMAALSVVITTAMERQYAERDDLGFAQRLLVAPGALLWYYGKSLLPIDLAPFYPTWPASPRDYEPWVSIGLLAICSVALFVARRRMPPWTLWGIVSFGAFLLPIVGIASFGNIGVTWVSDHYVYYGLVALYAAVVAAGAAVLPGRSPGARALVGAALLIPTAGVMAFQSVQYTPVFKDAHSFWQRTIEKNPQLDLAYKGRAYAHIGAGQFDKAAADLIRTAELNPKRTQARTDLGWVYNQAGRHEDAIRVLRALLKDEPNNGKAMVHLAQALLAEGKDPAEAEQLYQAALRDDPGYDEAAANLALMYAQTRRLGEAETVVRGALEKNPSSGMLWRALGQHCDGQGKTTEAQAAFQKAVEFDPFDADALFGLGVTHFRQRQFDEAVLRYEQAIAVHPRIARYWNNLGCAHLDAGRAEIAAEKLRRAVEIDAFDAPAWNNLGAAYDRLNRRADALAAFEKAVEIDPAYWRAGNRLVATLISLGRYQDAAQRLNQFVTPGTPPDGRRAYSLQMALLAAAAPDDQVRRPDFALRLIEAVQKNSATESAEVLDVLATAQAASGDFERAGANAKRAAELYEAAGRSGEAATIRQRIALFEAHEPYRLSASK
ncbi:MAG: tetratricopeptide repeat protein [Phycisphaerales bacterium]|nr:tetratricopeptide repeat protein [Phycisphaerales bacterium]